VARSCRRVNWGYVALAVQQQIDTRANYEQIPCRILYFVIILYVVIARLGRAIQ
jgi:hypothetical protein